MSKEDSSTERWFNKSCESNRVATIFLYEAMKKGKRVQWKFYLGGGSVDAEQTELLCGAVVLAKNWKWAALTYLAAWVLTCCCPSGEPAWPDLDLFFLEQGSENNSGVKFKDMCDQYWTILSIHPAFQEWPMGSPPGSTDAAMRVHNARLCSERLKIMNRVMVLSG